MILTKHVNILECQSNQVVGYLFISFVIYHSYLGILILQCDMWGSGSAYTNKA